MLLADDGQTRKPLTRKPRTLARRRRRGVTAMEYLVMASVIIVVVILAVQHIGRITGGSLANSAQATKPKG